MGKLRCTAFVAAERFPNRGMMKWNRDESCPPRLNGDIKVVIVVAHYRMRSTWQKVQDISGGVRSPCHLTWKHVLSCPFTSGPGGLECHKISETMSMYFLRKQRSVRSCLLPMWMLELSPHLIISLHREVCWFIATITQESKLPKTSCHIPHLSHTYRMAGIQISLNQCVWFS